VPHADYQVTIARPVAQVFEFFADGEKNPQWRTSVIEIKKLSGDGLGAQYEQSIRGPGGRPTTRSRNTHRMQRSPSPSLRVRFDPKGASISRTRLRRRQFSSRLTLCSAASKSCSWVGWSPRR
jgi:hypothetical protein